MCAVVGGAGDHRREAGPIHVPGTQREGAYAPIINVNIIELTESIQEYYTPPLEAEGGRGWVIRRCVWLVSAQDLKRSVKYYKEVLGMKEVEYPLSR